MLIDVVRNLITITEGTPQQLANTSKIISPSSNTKDETIPNRSTATDLSTIKR
jgi:hypothetical protein